MGIPASIHPENLGVPDAAFACPDLTTLVRLDELDLDVVGQRLESDRSVLALRVVEAEQWCRRCGCQGLPRDTVVRRLAHEPVGRRPTTLLITFRRPRYTSCGHVWRPDASKAAEPRTKLLRRSLRWALEGIVCQHLTVARVAGGLGVSCNTANDAVLAEGKCVLIDVIPICEGTGPARLLDMVEGRSEQACRQGLTERADPWRQAVEVVAMYGFTSLQDRHSRGTARCRGGHGPFHIVRLACDALDACRECPAGQSRARRTHGRPTPHLICRGLSTSAEI
ncbi:transposase [Kocuria sp. CPCC 205292]|uniref:transposase n=1 Tax=Kocuria cellulosilytica TaxID=3071451 RepID=UPI0034D74722